MVLEIFHVLIRSKFDLDLLPGNRRARIDRSVWCVVGLRCARGRNRRGCAAVLPDDECRLISFGFSFLQGFLGFALGFKRAEAHFWVAAFLMDVHVAQVGQFVPVTHQVYAFPAATAATWTENPWLTIAAEAREDSVGTSLALGTLLLLVLSKVGAPMTAEDGVIEMVPSIFLSLPSPVRRVRFTST